MNAQHGLHYSTAYTAAFHKNGYYHIDQLTDKRLTVEHMMEIISHLKEGTAWVIKREVLKRVAWIQKGKEKK